MNVLNLTGWIFKFGFLARYRRTIAIVINVLMVIVGGLMSQDVLGMCNAEVSNLCDWLKSIQPWLLTFSGYLGTAGVIFKNDKPKSFKDVLSGK